MPTRLLLPIALAQGLWVRGKTVPRLPPASGHRGAFGRRDDSALSVVGVGDSIIAGVGVERQERALVGHFARRLHERMDVRCGGAPMAEWRRFDDDRERVAPLAPAADVYIVSAGVNDAVRGVSVAKFTANLAGLAATLRCRFAAFCAGLRRHPAARPVPGIALAARRRARRARSAPAGGHPRRPRGR